MLVQMKIELKRSLNNKMMLLSLLLGCTISISHVIQYVFVKDVYDSSIMWCPESVYYNWIGASSFPMQSYLYYLILPILAVLPAGTLLYDDIKSGYVKNVFIRTKKSNYFIAKYVAVFISGGIAFVLPLIINFVLTSMWLPNLIPEPIIGIGPSLTSVGYEVYYSHPLLYNGLFLLVDFIFAGGMVSISLIAAYFVEHKFVVLISPFISYYFLYSLNNIIGINSFAPNYFLIPGFYQNYIWEFVISFAIIIISFIFYLGKGLTNETY